MSNMEIFYVALAIIAFVWVKVALLMWFTK